MRHRPLPLLVLLVSLALTALVSWSIHRESKRRDHARLDNATQAAVDRIQARMVTYEAMLHANAALFGASPELSGSMYRRFVSEMDLGRQHPGFLGIGFSRRLEPNERAAWVELARRDHPQFRIWPAGEREEYHTITWLEPLHTRNAAAIGYDMHTESVRREAMDRARDTGKAALSGRVFLVQELDDRKQPGFVMYVPVYKGATPPTVEGRRRDLVGFSYGPFRAGDLFQGIFGSETAPRVVVSIYEGSEVREDSFLASSAGHGRASPTAEPARVPLDVAGRQCTLVVRPTDTFEEASGQPLVRLSLGAGTTASFLLFGLSLLQLRARSGAERLAEERRAAFDQRAALLGSEHEARVEAEVLNGVLRAMASELDEEKLIQLITDESTRVTGAAFGAFFRNLVNEKDESCTLYTLSGVPHSAFEKLPLPRKTALFAETFSSSAVVRLDDVTKDPRFGKNPPHHGLPAGHVPVASYLAVPVKTHSGKPIGGLLFGHPQPGMFQARHERIVIGLAAQAAIALDNARLYREARDADRRKDEFLAMLAHELRNPLTPVVTALHLMKMRAGDPKVAARSHEVISRQVERLVRLVDDLLDVARITRGRIQLRRERIDLRGIVSRAMAAMQPVIEARWHEVAVALPDEPVWVEADPLRIEQVLCNLVHNAAKYTEPHGKIWITLSAAEGEALLSVTDNGVGIPPAFLARIFDLFAQSERSLDRSQGGLGIGLTLVRLLAELHGGRVEARSNGPGTGSEFLVRLPASRAADAPSPEGNADRTRPKGGRRRVLVIEDSPDNAEMFQECLEHHGHEVRVALSGPAGIELALAQPPDVILLDIGLPGMDGYEAVRRLRRYPELASTRIIAVTGYAQEADRERAMAAGFDLHLAKPVDPERLTAALDG